MEASSASPRLQGTRTVSVTAAGPARILIVEDDPEVRGLLEEHLTGLRHQTVGVASPTTPWR